ncbi:MAG: hypothetical protein K9G67_11305 [Bacteroidales bacterium]|nr:hypothetical protein [Bacteroidales bacterium]MCF8343491.1 hypothetical protein [Bacteroidales bacterium]MCF8352111.1 hypothetical protein [Bacteroidales bacterium]MCF8376934.1 hypothetical protein [Bacteroidales bacterium]MCF8402134.1 hypothetical protein [Bacteroidales bacterium]
MNIDTIKVELIDWITQIKDRQSISKLLSLKKELSNKKKKEDILLFGSGKHLIEYVSDDFNEPLDVFEEYQK